MSEMGNKNKPQTQPSSLQTGREMPFGRLSLRASLASPNAETAWRALMNVDPETPDVPDAQDAPDTRNMIAQRPQARAEFDARDTASGESPAPVKNRASMLSLPALKGDWALREVECAREFNFELPEDVAASVEMIEQAIQNVMDVKKSVVLVFDEHSGVYSCLNDLKTPGGKVRELTRIADWFLQELVGTPEDVLHSYLMLHNRLIGIVVVSEKADGAPFTPQDQMRLDILAPYLASKVLRFRNLQQSLMVPYIQSVVLSVAGQLITAVDQDDIMTIVLEAFANRLGFDACQYVGFNEESGVGEVLYEVRTTPASSGGDDLAAADRMAHVQSYSHAGLEGRRRVIRDYAGMVGLMSSMARNRHYLHLHGRTLGEHSLQDVFGIDNIHSALLLPVTDIASGQVRGTFNLFHATPAVISEESREIAREVTFLASRALGRAMVLEKALTMASSDELTGLINRRGFYHRFEAELERARRQNATLCVALIDVDHFKSFNDTYGHLSGDLVLKALADLFAKNLRKSDVVCRFGGEEFAILLPDTGMKAAIDLMERVRQSVETMQLCGIHGETLRVTISAGLVPVAVQKQTGAERRSEISEALAKADEQLYAAKNAGRNRVYY